MTQFFFTAFPVLPQFCAGRVSVYRQSLIRSQAAARPIVRRLWSTAFRRLYYIISEQAAFFNAELKYFPSIRATRPAQIKQPPTLPLLNALSKRQGGHFYR
jgi:hypothetical protein